jgi:pimeloyl-ACP methyl ester carboxylesterase
MSRVRVVAASMCFLLGGLSPGIASEVHLFTGWLHVYSMGLQTIANQVPMAKTALHTNGEAAAVADRIIARVQRGEAVGPIALVGHSLGGNAITMMANRLAQYRIPVAYLGVLDAVGPSPIPGNVAVVDNFMSTCGWFSGQRLRAGPDFHGESNLMVRQRTCHIELDDDPAVQARIVSLITLMSYGFLDAPYHPPTDPLRVGCADPGAPATVAAVAAVALTSDPGCR